MLNNSTCGPSKRCDALVHSSVRGTLPRGYKSLRDQRYVDCNKASTNVFILKQSAGYGRFAHDPCHAVGSIMSLVRIAIVLAVVPFRHFVGQAARLALDGSWQRERNEGLRGGAS